MLADAATQTQIDGYKQDLRPRAERAIVRRFHKALRDGAADDVLSSMRDVFTEHAQAIARTRAVINPDSELEHIVASAQPGDDTIELWQQLPVHLAAVSQGRRGGRSVRRQTDRAILAHRRTPGRQSPHR